MADDQQFCLRWNNHQSTLISVFDTLLENGTLVDCTLAAEGQSLKAHKVVLSACSPYLETLLSEHYEKHPIIIMKDVKFTELKSMMDYMYRGEVNICQDQLGTFLKAAESLQIKGLSENGEGDARDVGSTTTRPPPPKRPPATPAARTDPEQPPAASPAHRPRDGSISPSSRKRRRTRRNSDDANHFDSNSCDLPLTPAQSTPVVPNIPASITSTPIRTPVVKPEINDRLDHNSLPPESGLLKEKIEPAEQLLEPKTEYLEDLNNDDSVEDLTLDDDDEMDMSQMSNMSNMSRPGPSHGTDISNQGFSPWQLGNQSGGNDEVFMAAQEAVNSHRDSQGKSPSPTVHGRKVPYSKETMEKATEAVRGGMRLVAASRRYGIPRSSLSKYLLGRHSEHRSKKGPPPLLIPQEERSIVDWVLSIERANLPIYRDQLKSTVLKLAKESGRPQTLKKPGKEKWFIAFLERHPLITRRLNQVPATSKVARKAKENIKQWFAKVNAYVEEKDIKAVFKDPKRIFSADEASFPLFSKDNQYMVKKEKKPDGFPCKNDDNESEFMPVLMTANAAGDVLPPMVSFHFEGIPAVVANHFPDSWGVGKSNNGWMTTESFHEYVTDVFHPWILSNNIQLPVVLFINGHNLPVTKHLSDFCAKSQIELVGLYPSSAKYPHPMDPAVFDSLSASWKEAVWEWCLYNKREKVKKEEFSPLLREVFDYTLKKEKVQNGFKTTGLTDLTFRDSK